uniref:Uncharacterized protein n=1 Tax=Bosea sp. NBC_00436 TaxID=2969620 RepID=A0A9E7ZXW1_9HYPH
MTMSTPELRYWADRAALLDPACHVYNYGNSWSASVPVGENWYAMNIWGARVVGGSARVYHRLADANIDHCFKMPASYSIDAGGATSLILYARPRLIQETDTLGPAGSNRYQRDPRRLFYERLDRLKRLPLNVVEVSRPAGTLAATITETFLPNDFTRGLVTHWNCHDGAYLALMGPGSNIINTQDELDDKYPMRFTASVLLPFSRSVFDRVKLSNGSHDGTWGAQDGNQSWGGYGTAHYVKLPADW